MINKENPNFILIFLFVILLFLIALSMQYWEKLKNKSLTLMEDRYLSKGENKK